MKVCSRLSERLIHTLHFDHIKILSEGEMKQQEVQDDSRRGKEWWI